MQGLNSTIKTMISKPMIYCFGNDFRLTFLFSRPIATTTDMNVEKQSNINIRRKLIPKQYVFGMLIIVLNFDCAFTQGCSAKKSVGTHQL